MKLNESLSIKVFFTESTSPYKVKLNFSILGSIIEISSNSPPTAFTPNDSMRDLLGIKPEVRKKK